VTTKVTLGFVRIRGNSFTLYTFLLSQTSNLCGTGKVIGRRSKETCMKAGRIAAAGAAALATCGMLGMTPAQVSSASTQTWTQQDPAVHPPARDCAAMAYDAATGTAVLFGGYRSNREAGDTWTWDGTTWTHQHPAVHPPARGGAAMAYDAATGTVVMFGGYPKHGGIVFADTWTWDGTNWTQQTPATSPPARAYASMAYDAATGTAVLFGSDPSADTWTWDGTNWTQQAPATSPPAREAAAMAYDAATGTVVLFSGYGHNYLSDTWTWG
jgi:hypothetical protein